MNKSKFLSPVSAFILILSLFTALSFESLHAGHEEHCHEENCPVCLVVTTVFPEYDWVKEILGKNIKNADLTLSIMQKNLDVLKEALK